TISIQSLQRIVATASAALTAASRASTRKTSRSNDSAVRDGIRRPSLLPVRSSLSGMPRVKLLGLIRDRGGEMTIRGLVMRMLVIGGAVPALSFSPADAAKRSSSASTGADLPELQLEQLRQVVDDDRQSLLPAEAGRSLHVHRLHQEAT